MPLYEYHCPDCKNQVELLIRGNEQPECPQCNGRRLAKQLSVPAAPASGGSELPLSRSMSDGGCGLPQCGQGRCGMV